MSVFRGLVFCATGLETAHKVCTAVRRAPNYSRQDELQGLVQRMGGSFNPHLTRQVTHLLAARILHSPKYLVRAPCCSRSPSQSAKKLRIPVLLPDFVQDCWSRSHLGPLDLHHMEAAHAVPTLYGCRISVTGVPADERARIAQLVAVHGGAYAPDLTAKCTHLIVQHECEATLRASPKVIFAKKCSVPMVSPAWLYQCVAKRVCLEDAPFRLDLGPPSSSQLSGPAPSLLYNDLTADEIVQVADLPPYLDGLHVYVDDQIPPERLFILKKLILVAGGIRHSDLYDRSLITHFIIDNQTLSPREIEQLEQFGTRLPAIVHDQWLFACFYAKERLPLGTFLIDVVAILKASSDLPSHPHAQPATTVLSAAHPAKTPATSWSLRPASPERPVTEGGGSPSLPLFSGLSFGLLYDREPIRAAQITELIEKRGGTVVDGHHDNADYIISPIVGCTAGSSVVSELWLEQCIVQNRLLGPDECSFFRPLVCPPSADRSLLSPLCISVSGYSGIERQFYSCLSTALGAVYTENLSRKNTHLLCAVASGPKYEFAKATRQMVCTTASWLVDCARQGALLDPRPYQNDALTDSRPCQDENQPPITGPDTSRAKRLSEASSAGLCGEAKTPKRVKESSVAFPSFTLSPESSSTSAVLACPAANPAQNAKTAANTLPLPVLQDTVVSISQRLWHRREEIHDLVVEMGGAFVWSYDKSCTHYIHQGNSLEETFREFKIVKQHGTWICSPWWLVRCKESGARLSESHYTHVFSPAGGEQSISQPQPTHLQSSTSLPFSPERDSSPLAQESEPPAIDFDSLIASDRKGARRTISYNLSLPRTLPEHAAAVETAAAEAPAPDVAPRLFALSGITPDQRSTFPRIILSLGGQVQKCASNWETNTTHLVIGTLSKSEKFLAACAAGVWVLRPEYLEACEKSGVLVEERPFEWAASWSDPPLSLAAAPRFWRERLRISFKRAFAGWRVLLVADQKRIASLRSILLSGDAEVFTIAEIDTADRSWADRLTHAMVSSAQMKAKLPASLVSQLGGRLCSVELIASHLLDTSTG